MFDSFQLRYFGTMQLGILKYFFFFLNSLDYGNLIKENQSDNLILNLYFDLPCRTSPRSCSRGSPGGWFWNKKKLHLKIKTKVRFKVKR